MDEELNGNIYLKLYQLIYFYKTTDFYRVRTEEEKPVKCKMSIYKQNT